MNDSKHRVLKPSLCALALALSLASGPALAAKLKAERDWHADGNGNYVHRSTGQVISDAQYTDLVAQEVYNRFNTRAGYVPGHCVLPSGR